MTDNKDNKNEFDVTSSSHKMDLYSRAIAALGVDTMKNLGGLRVLIIGLRGVGVETAKNIILAGPKSVTVYDVNKTKISDLGANFYLRKEHVGKLTRGEACVKSLSELNPYVDVSNYDKELSKDFIQSFGAVVITDTLPKKQMCEINTYCRTRKIKNKEAPAGFIVAVTHGVSSHFFSDFGPKHVVKDSDGEPTQTLVVDDWTPDGVITVAAKRHGFDDGDLIKIEDIESGEVNKNEIPITVLNEATGIKVKRIYRKLVTENPDGTKNTREIQVFEKFQLDLSNAKTKDNKAIDIKTLSKWKTGGVITGIKKERVLEFRSFEDSLINPNQGWMQDMFGPPHPDQGDWQEHEAGKIVHLLYNTAFEFYNKYETFPRLHNEDDANNFLNLYKEINKSNKENETGIFVNNIDEKRIRGYSWYFECELTGYCAFLGGVAAQEIVKLFGKYTPVFQWLHSDHKHFLGNQIPSDAIPQNSRYDHQISIFGKSFQQVLSNQKIFLVGCGALGCEYLKGISLMGICCGPEGKLWCTDMDHIEVSNLSRQFLFRAKHVGKPKSIISAQSAKEMNNSLNVEPLEMKVWPETEDYFDDNFWDNLDLCWNALDNVHARKYTDSKCLFHGKPLLESGTQGTKCNSEVIIPFKTKSYNDGEEQETEGIPMCTLQNFPYLPVHCIEWARSSFTGQFESNPKTFNAFIENQNKFFEQVENASGKEKLQMLRDVKSLMDKCIKGANFNSCIQLAFEELCRQHVTRIKDLMHWFPKDHKNSEGKDFWTGHKKFPQIPSLTDDSVVKYLYCSSNLFAYAFGIDNIRDEKVFKETLNKLKLKFPEWKKPTGKAVKTDEDDDEKDTDNNTSSQEDQEIEQLIEDIKKIDPKKLKILKETEFEKDDDSNFHIDYITACANLRAWNYRIKATSRHECKIIAGKIIAALATTTAMITGLVELEFYKLKLGLGYTQEDAFFNANINLAVSQFQYFQPESAIRNIEKKIRSDVTNQIEIHTPYPNQWTTWDKLVVDEGNITVQQLVDLFPKLFWGVEPTLLFKAGKLKEGKLLYNGSQVLRSTKMQQQLINRPNCSNAQKKLLQQQIDNANKYNENIKKGRNSKVIDRYIEIYGKLVSDKRNYVILGGDFEDSNGNTAVLPPIQFIFKH